MTIPEIRGTLLGLAKRGDLPDDARTMLFDLAFETVRRRHGPRPPAKSRKVTEKLAQEIRDYAAEHPKALQADIAKYFNVNAGRVSEALYGRRA